MGLFDKLDALFAKEEIKGVGRIHLIGTVVSPNEIASPMSGMNASLIVLSLLERILVHGGSSQSGQTEREVFRSIASVGLGALVIADGKGQKLEVPVMQNDQGLFTANVVPLSKSGVPIEANLPPVLGRFVGLASGEHMLFWRETLFRNGDRVRIKATIAKSMGIKASGYRDEPAEILVATPPIELHEML